MSTTKQINGVPRCRLGMLASLCTLLAVTPTGIGETPPRTTIASSSQTQTQSQTHSQTTATSQPASSPAAAPASPAGQAPEGELITVPELDIRFRLPEGAKAETRAYTYRVTPGVTLPDGIGVIAIESQPTKRAGDSLAKIENRIISRYLGLNTKRPINTSRPIETGMGKLVGIPHIISAPGKDLQARYVHLNSHHPMVKDGQPAFQGFCVYPTGESDYVIFLLLTDVNNLGPASLAFETMLATVEPEIGNNASGQLVDALDAGTAFARSITADDIREAIVRVDERYDRLYRADESGNESRATERGYRRVRVYEGRRGDVSGKPEGSWSNAQFDAGFVVEMNARLIGTDDQTGLRSVTDSISTFFLSEDRREESWNTRMKTRIGEGPNAETTIWSMTGSRRGSSMSVRMMPNSGVGRNITPRVLLEGYLSQVESFLLADLLAARGSEGDFAFRSYQPNLEEVTLRGHRMGRADEAGWLMDIKMPDGRFQTTQLDTDGAFVRTVLPNGLVWDPTELKTLYNIWRRKGLPLD